MHTHGDKGEEEVYEIDERDDDDEKGDAEQGVSRRFVADRTVGVGNRPVEIRLCQGNKVNPHPLHRFSQLLFVGIGIAGPQCVLHSPTRGSLQVVLGHSFHGLEIVRVAPFVPTVYGLVPYRADRLENGQVGVHRHILVNRYDIRFVISPGLPVSYHNMSADSDSVFPCR